MSHQAIDRPPGHVIVIEPSKGWGSAKPRNLFDDPDPLRFFVWLNVNVRIQFELRQVHTPFCMSYLARLIHSLRLGRTGDPHGMSPSRSS